MHLSFFFDSDLTDERKQAIVKWLNSLTPDQQKMVEELREDAQDEAEFFAYEQG